MFVTLTTLALLFRLAATAVAGLVAMMAFVVLTVDRLNARLAEIETRLAARDPRHDRGQVIERPGEDAARIAVPLARCAPTAIPAQRTAVGATLRRWEPDRGTGR